MTSISGAISGLDTATIINQLVQVDANQQTLIKTRQTGAQKAADAYSAVITSLKGLGTQATAIGKIADWQGSTATSSTASVTASAKGTISASLTFDVTQTAARHALIASAPVSGTSAVVASGPLKIVDGTGAVRATLDVGGGSLAEVVAAVNGSSTAGLQASAVQVSPGQYRLQLTSNSSGADSKFTVTGLTGTTNVLSTGQNASITVGSNPMTAYTVTSASNTFTDVVPGLSFTVSKAETGVTVGAAVDGTAVATQIGKLVETANSLLSDLASKSSYDQSTKTGAALFGESTVRNLQQGILSAVSASATPGISLTRNGKLSFDQTAFLDAFRADPKKVAAAYGASTGFTPGAGLTGGVAIVSPPQSGSLGGDYAVKVTKTATTEQWRVDPPGGVVKKETFVVTQGAKSITFTASNSDTETSAAAALNSQMAAAGMSVSTSLNGTSMLFTAGSTGSAEAFTVTFAGAAGTKVTAGQDVAGTIDGKAATGSGSTLTASDPASGAYGLSLAVTASPADLAATSGNLGKVNHSVGLPQRLATLVEQATDTQTGSLTKAKSSRLDAVKDLQKQVDAWDLRLASRRTMLTKQFTAMESAMRALQSSTSSLAGLMG